MKREKKIEIHNNNSERRREKMGIIKRKKRNLNANSFENVQTSTCSTDNTTRYLSMEM